MTETVKDAYKEFILFLDHIADGILMQLPSQIIVTYMFLVLGDPFNRQGNTKSWTRNAALLIIGVYTMQRLHERLSSLHGGRKNVFNSPEHQ